MKWIKKGIVCGKGLRQGKRADFFSRLEDSVIRDLAKSCTTITLPPRALLFRQGDASSHLYALIKGEIKIYSDTKEEAVSYTHLRAHGDS